MNDGAELVLESQCYGIISAVKKSKLKDYECSFDGFSVRVRQTAPQCKGVVRRILGFDHVEVRQCRRKAVLNGYCFGHTKIRGVKESITNY